MGEPFLNVNCKHLQEFDADLYRQLINYPQEVVPTFDMAVNQMFFDRFPDASLEHQIQVRPYNADKTSNMRSLNPEGKWPFVLLDSFYFLQNFFQNLCFSLQLLIFNLPVDH